MGGKFMTKKLNVLIFIVFLICRMDIMESKLDNEFSCEICHFFSNSVLIRKASISPSRL